MRLLVVAPMCDKDDVGESWVAYQWVSRLAARHDITVLTYHKRGHQSVAEQLPGVRVIEWREAPLVGRAERLNSMLKPAYFLFLLQARRWLRRALRSGERFDVAHQIVPVATRYPSPLAGSPVPYVLGPVGGSLAAPAAFAAEDSSPWYVRLRRFDQWRLRRDPWLRRTFRDASVVLGITRETGQMLAPAMLKSFRIMGDTGLERLPELDAKAPSGGTLRLLYVGRLVRTKGARDAIRAVALLPDLPLHLDVVGDGFDRAECESLVASLDVGDRVSFHGRLPREDVDTMYRQADVFVFPSYREPGGLVVSEAMSFGLPLIVSDRGGPGSTVDDSCGLRVPAVDPPQYAQAIADAIRTLAENPEAREAMGRAARERAGATLLWDSKLERLEAIYAEVLGATRGGVG